MKWEPEQFHDDFVASTMYAFIEPYQQCRYQLCLYHTCLCTFLNTTAMVRVTMIDREQRLKEVLRYVS